MAKIGDGKANKVKRDDQEQVKANAKGKKENL